MTPFLLAIAAILVAAKIWPFHVGLAGMSSP